MTYTREERAERLAEMKRQPFPRASIARLNGTMDPPESWVELIEQHINAEIVDRYLHGFVAPGAEAPCPFCGSTISFSWGLVHGQGNCQCGWPGTLYHYVRDNRDDYDLLCARAECGKPRGEHVWRKVSTVKPLRMELRCPIDSRFSLLYAAPLVVRFTRVLWAHPYGVHIRPGFAQ